MHILMVTSSFPRYNGDFFGPWVMEYSCHLVEMGNRVTIVAPQSLKHKGPTIEIEGLNIEYFTYAPKYLQGLVAPPGLLPNLRTNVFYFFAIPLLLLGYLRAIRRVIKENQIDILHSQWAIPAGFINTLMSKKYNIPHVVSTLGAELYISRRHIFSRFTNYVLKNCQALFSVSNQMKERALRFDISENNICVLPNSVNPGRFINEKTGYLKNKLNIGEDVNVILTIRRLVPEKRVVDLLEAFKCLNDLHSVLVIGGDGPLRVELQHYCEEYNLVNRVYFLGYVDSTKLPKYYADADVYVLSSEQEGLSISLLESMAAGCIVVSTIGSGSEDVIQDGLNGFLYSVGEVDELQNILQNISKMNPADKKMMSNKAISTIESKFSNNYVLGEWIKIYSRLILNNNP